MGWVAGLLSDGLKVHESCPFTAGSGGERGGECAGTARQPGGAAGHRAVRQAAGSQPASADSRIPNQPGARSRASPDREAFFLEFLELAKRWKSKGSEEKRVGITWLWLLVASLLTQ